MHGFKLPVIVCNVLVAAVLLLSSSLQLHNHHHNNYCLSLSFGKNVQKRIRRQSRQQQQQRQYQRFGVQRRELAPAVSQLITPTTIIPHEENDTAETITIYDNVYSPETCSFLHHLAKEHSDQMGKDETGSIFYRKSSQLNNNNNNNSYQVVDVSRNNNEMTILEQAIDNILTNICNDTTTNVVEYWSRQEYLNMDVHCDIDEVLLELRQKKRRGAVRCPEYAHILYLKVQLPKTNDMAPTCIFPTKLGGWMTGTTTTTTTTTTITVHDSGGGSSGKEELNISSNQNRNMSIVDLVIVPAVSGRVVRFAGPMMHAVPKPADRWLTTAKQTTTGRPHYNDDDDEDENELRSVLLFNCWSNNMPPPIGVKTYKYCREHMDDVVPDGIVIDDNDDEYINATTFQNDPASTHSLLRSMESDCNDNQQQSTIAINERWTTTPITMMNQSHDTSLPSSTKISALSSLRVRLMGNKYRRQYHKSVANLYMDENDKEALVQAIEESVTPTRIQLLQSNDE